MFKSLLVLAALVLSASVFALEAAKEYEIKAAFLFNLSAFITWPDSAFASKDAPFNVCVLGNDPFGERLDLIAADQTVSGHPVAVRRIAAVADALACHSVFISNSEQLRLQAIFAQLAGKPVLTVGDVDNFVIQGGTVQFFPHDNKIRLLLDPEAFRDAGLKASAHLMRVAQLVKGK